MKRFRPRAKEEQVRSKLFSRIIVLEEKLKKEKKVNK